MKPLKILKYVIVALLLSFMAFIAFRIMMTSDRSTLKEIVSTESAKAAYAADGDGAFLYSDIPDEMSPDGYFTAYEMAFCPAGRELQITVRYNDSLYEKYLPGSDPEKYYFVLKDKEGNVVSRATVVGEKERYFYNHFRLAFDGVVLSEESELYLFLCSDESSYPADHTEGVLLVHPSIKFSQRRLTSEEKALFKKAN